MKALQFRATSQTKNIYFVVALNALCRYFSRQATRHQKCSLYNCKFTRVRQYLADNRLINLDAVKGEAPQIAYAGKPRAKIV